MVSKVIQVPHQQFVQTAVLEPVTQRALRYLESGYSLHLEGPTGIGKSALASHLAERRQRPILWMMGGQDLPWQDQSQSDHGDGRRAQFTQACCEGWTLVYDEFNRSRPEVNTVLLSALEERRVMLPGVGGQNCVSIHPELRVIFTSNAAEYCGTYNTQHALLDRLITLRLPVPHVLDQQRLLVELVGLSRDAAALVTGVVQQFFRQVEPDSLSSLRPQLMIAQVCHHTGIRVAADNAEFRQVCRDILLSRAGQSTADANEVLWELFNRLAKTMPTFHRTPSRLHHA